jgi:hypothetical protein
LVDRHLVATRTSDRRQIVSFARRVRRIHHLTHAGPAIARIESAAGAMKALTKGGLLLGADASLSAPRIDL